MFYTAFDELGKVWAAVEYFPQTCTFEEWIRRGPDLREHPRASPNFATR